MNKKANRLINEKSPYLLQHAYNPVEWYPWGEEAFTEAARLNKPVFLSIGYSTCHWCHVMEKESFENAEVAELMNEYFINVKVDREERPDIDSIYMNVCQVVTGSGGWPLTILLTPDKKPFFAGTYFPKESRFGRIGLVKLIPQIMEVWQNKKEDINKAAEEIISALSVEEISVAEEIDKSIFEQAYDEYLKKYDKSFGGFGNAPKFPSPHNLLFLLRYYKRNNDKFALEMVENTLLRMRAGGVYDQVGFGFHRYSTDRKWIIPHFEKMLYDQALLAVAYTETYQASGKEFYREVTEEIFEYVLRDMTSAEGLFYSAEDADSEGEEGKFYLWTRQDLLSILDEDEFELFTSVFQIEEEGNWVDPVHNSRNGTNILFVTAHSEADIKLHSSKNLFFDPALSNIRKKLFEKREERVHPFKDDKVLTDWNALMISALARGAAVFGNEEYSRTAENAMNMLLKKMITPEGKLLHRYRDGEAAVPGTLDDYAFTIQALLDLYELVFNPDYLIQAIDLSETTGKLFWDNKAGGYYFTPSDGEKLIVRQKEIYDGAVPSGNSVSLLNLIRLGKMTGNSLFEEKANSAIRIFARTIKSMPAAYSQSLVALDFALNKSFEIVIAKDSGSAEEVISAIRKEYIPGKVMLLRSEKYSDKLFKAAPYLENQKPIDKKTTIYVCSDFICSNPVHTVEEAVEIVNRA
jgi:uncharacterized protein